MRSHTPNNLVSWLELSQKDVRNAIDFIEAMNGSGTRDELGFLTLQLAFAERFYPGVSTQLTLARHFYFLPAFYEIAYREGKTSGEAAAFVGDRQRELKKVLNATCGTHLKEDSKTLPSDFYWSALQKLGFMKAGWSESAYLNGLDAARRGEPPWRSDGGEQHSGQRRSEFWDKRPDPEFLGKGGKIRVSKDLDRLSPAEARDLRRRYERLGPNLLSHLIDLRLRGQAIDSFEWPWQIPAPPWSISGLKKPARRLSRMVRGMTLQYAYYVADFQCRGRGRNAKLESIEDEWRGWHQVAEKDLLTFDLDAFFGLEPVEEALGNNTNLKDFVREWMRLFRRRAGEQKLLRDARELVKNREQHCKVLKSRFLEENRKIEFNHTITADDPEQAAREFQFAYRHRVGRSIATQICDGLQRGNR